MKRSTEEVVGVLVSEISSLPQVMSVGISGGKAVYPKAGEGDIDMFVYCDTIPVVGIRKELLDKMAGLLEEPKVEVFTGGHFGIGDLAYINGVETWIMYFTTKETTEDVEAILAGKHPDRDAGNYYPVGRLAMFRTMNILFDRNGFLGSLQSKLAIYPDPLSEILVEYHLPKTNDAEDFGRAVKRKDPLFYHCTLEQALDHFLQALFAMNKTYFPSRKRSLEYIGKFAEKPDNCGERLLDVLKYGGYPEGIDRSYGLWCELVRDLVELDREHKSKKALLTER